MSNALSQIQLPGRQATRSGKVREIFDLGDVLLFVASDRLSAFDVVLPTPIPEKGRVLTALSEFWFGQLKGITQHHFLSSDFGEIARRVGPHEALRGRSMLVRKCQPLAVECIVRGYLSGSGWKEYKKSQTVCGIPLPAGLAESAKLPAPIFTPSTKAETGHDENINFAQASEILGTKLANQVRDLSLAIYQFARDYAAARGIIIADTKFEFGLIGDQVILIDEVLTPDSSRFWPAAQYQPGGAQPSYDKQFVRDYLETLSWNKQPPGPALPSEVVAKTTEKYLEALHQLTV